MRSHPSQFREDQHRTLNQQYVVIYENYKNPESIPPTMEESRLVDEQDFACIPQSETKPEILSHPLKHRPFHLYTTLPGKPAPTFHDVIKIKKVDSKHHSLYFFKRNDHNRITINHETFMYQLEAANCEMYHFIAPNHSPTARVLIDPIGHETGISSKAIPDFKSTLENPLKEEDLNIPALKHFTVPQLEELNQVLKNLNFDLDNADPDAFFKIENNKITLEKPPNLAASVFNFFKISNNNPVITVRDLNNYRIVEALAIIHATSHFFAEDDLHRGNMDIKKGRIDFDMSAWPVLSEYKETTIFDFIMNWAFRNPEGRFPLTENDIRHLPNLVDSNPFYFSTKPANYIPEAVLQQLAKKFPISQNAFLIQDNQIYQQLEKHPVFIYHKFATYFKIALMPEEMIRQLIGLHVREDSIDPNTNNKIIDILTNYIEMRYNKLKNILIEMPEFKLFLDDYGDTVFADIYNNWIKHNEKYILKSETDSRYQNYIVDLSKVENNYLDMRKEIEKDLMLSFVHVGK